MCFASQVAVLASALASREELEEYKDAFELFDRNGDGLLDQGDAPEDFSEDELCKLKLQARAASTGTGQQDMEGRAGMRSLY